MLTKNIRLEKQRSRKQGAPSLWSGQTDTDIMLAKNNGTNQASIIWMRPSLVRPGRHRSTCNNRNSEIQRAPLLANWWRTQPIDTKSRAICHADQEPHYEQSSHEVQDTELDILKLAPWWELPTPTTNNWRAASAKSVGQNFVYLPIDATSRRMHSAVETQMFIKPRSNLAKLWKNLTPRLCTTT